MKNRAETRHGAVVVEFAIVAPLVILIIFAMFEFSRVNVIRHTADNAAYEAARIAMIPGATAAEAIAEANRILGAVSARGASVTIDPPTIDRSTTQVTVDVSVPMDQNAIIIPRFTGATTMQSSATMRTERVQTR